MKIKKILIVFGTRPEAIKMAPVIIELQRHPEFIVNVCVTGQHREMLDQVLSIFDIIPDYDLNIMKNGQDLFDITALITTGMRSILESFNPDLVMVHGDTTTSAIAALSGFYARIPVAHVEAGLRTYNKLSPWPEELNRQITGKIADFHFAPTMDAKNNLINEGISDQKVIVTGNTVIDALYMALAQAESKSVQKNLEQLILTEGYDINRSRERKLVLITGHRRENFGEGFKNICMAIADLSKKFSGVDFLYPVHLNPNVQKVVHEILGAANENQNIFLIRPVEYLAFTLLMKNSYIILTDSGGIQEEAPALGKPVIVMRETTERPEAVNSGTVILAGTDQQKIIDLVSDLLINRQKYDEMSNKINPYGDGFASIRIAEFLMNTEL